jgi:hypothetical protein
MRRRRAIWILLALLLAASAVRADSAARVEKRTYESGNHRYVLEVDPRWDESRQLPRPLLVFRHDGAVLWRRDESAFEDFRYPLDVQVSDDGKWLVFGGTSAHNISFDTEYREGLRLYSSEGKLIRFVSRRDLPVGDYGISTSDWYDRTRTHIEGERLFFFTPGVAEPLVFDLPTGTLVSGKLVPGQGDDSHHGPWLRDWVQGHG